MAKVTKLNPKAFPPLNPLKPSVFTDNDYTVQQAIGLLAGKSEEVVNTVNDLSDKIDTIEGVANNALENANTAIETATKASQEAQAAKDAADKSAEAAQKAQEAAEEAKSEVTDKFNTLSDKVDKEIEDRKNADNGLQAEIDRRITAEQQAREEKDSELEAKIDAEISRSETKDNELEEKLNKEIKDRTDKDSEIDTAIDGINDELNTIKAEQTVQNGRLEALETVTDSLNTRMGSYEESQAAQDTQIAAIQQHNTQTDAEIAALKAKDVSQDEEIEKLKTGSTDIASKLEEETQARIEADNNLQQQITDNKNECDTNITRVEEKADNNANAISKEEAARTTADENLQQQITENQTTNDAAIKAVEAKADKNESDITEIKKDYMPKSGGAFTGPVTVFNPSVDDNPATKKYVDDAFTAAGGIIPPEVAQRLSSLESEQQSNEDRLEALEDADNNFVPKTGGDFSGPLTIVEPTKNNNPATKQYVDNKVDEISDDYLLKSGGTITGNVTFGPDARLNGILTPQDNTDAVNKKYVDDNVNTLNSSVSSASQQAATASATAQTASQAAAQAQAAATANAASIKQIIGNIKTYSAAGVTAKWNKTLGILSIFGIAAGGFDSTGKVVGSFTLPADARPARDVRIYNGAYTYNAANLPNSYYPADITINSVGTIQVWAATNVNTNAVFSKVILMYGNGNGWPG